MSDPNDKKPATPSQGWPGNAKGVESDQTAGGAYEDPLAALDRIVSQGFEQGSQGQGGKISVSDDDLRILEQELIKELRGQHGDSASATPAAPQQRTQAPSLDDVMKRPHPLAQASRRQDPAPLDAPAVSLSGQSSSEQPRVQEPEAPMPQAPSVTAESSPKPIASGQRTALPSSDPLSSLDDWSSLFDEKPSAPKSSEGEGAHEPAPLGQADQGRGMPTSGSYGQLKQPSAEITEPITPTVPDAAQPSLPDVGAPSVTLEVPSSAAQDPEMDEGDRYYKELMANLRTEEQAPAVQPTIEQEPEVPAPQGYLDPETGQYYTEEQVQAYLRSAAYAEEQARVQTVEAPVVPDPAENYDYGQNAPTYAAGHQPDPYAVFDRTQDQSEPVAPDVGQAAQGEDSWNYPSSAPYYDPRQAHADQRYAGEYEASEVDVGADYARVPGAGGTYADPSVAQAAEESSPYYEQDEDYTTLEVAGAIPEKPTRRKSRKGLIAALAAGCVLVVGGVAVWGLGSGSDTNTETPVIKANTDPVKETPADPGGKVVPHQDQAVYGRIDGSENDEGPSNLMPATESPMTVTPDGRSARVISLSGGESSVSQSADSTGVASGPVAPKRVRTVVVRPDGTIVSSSPDQPQVSDATSVDQQMLDATPSEQAMLQTYNTNVDGSGLGGTSASGGVAGAGDSLSLLPRNKPEELINRQAAASSVAAPAAVVPRTIPQQAAPAASGTQSGSGPLVLTPPTAQNTAPANNSVANTAGGYTVQVTSQRSREQALASYRNIQSQLNGVLGGYEPDIKQADLGARGIYYRVRVGSFANQADAVGFCNQIKASGGDCILARK